MGRPFPVTTPSFWDDVDAENGPAVGVGTPTYVDDLAAKVDGAGQAFCAGVFLLLAGHAAGLLVKTHDCRWLTVDRPAPGDRAVLATLPVRVERVGTGLRVYGLSPEVASAILAAHRGPPPDAVERGGPSPGPSPPPWSAWSRTGSARATSRRRSYRGRTWKHGGGGLRESPFGVSCIRSAWPYLGACVASGEAEPARENDHDWQARDGAWERPLAKASSRASVLAATDCSPALRAAAWNTYIVSVIPYPAHVAMPGQRVVSRLQALFCEAMRLQRVHWAPWWVLPSLGILWGVRGAPRCPAATARVVAVLAHVRGDAWGPPRLARELEDEWRGILAWTSGSPDGRWPPAVRKRLADARRVIRRVAAERLWQPRSPVPHALGRALYVAAWAQRHEAEALRWFRERAERRRWVPGVLCEWELLTAARGYTAAHHVCRCLAGALPGGARWRPRQERQPRTCCACGAPAQSAWVAPHPDCDQWAWCRGCRGARRPERAWASLPAEWLPPDLRGSGGAAGEPPEPDGPGTLSPPVRRGHSPPPPMPLVRDGRGGRRAFDVLVPCGCTCLVQVERCGPPPGPGRGRQGRLVEEDGRLHSPGGIPPLHPPGTSCA